MSYYNNYNNSSFDPSCFFTEGFDNNGFESQAPNSFDDNIYRQPSNGNFYEFETPSYLGFGEVQPVPE